MSGQKWSSGRIGRQSEDDSGDGTNDKMTSGNIVYEGLLISAGMKRRAQTLTLFPSSLRRATLARLSPLAAKPTDTDTRFTAYSISRTSWAMPINYGHVYTAVPSSPACLSTSRLPPPRRSHQGQLLPKRPRGNTPPPRKASPFPSCSRIILVKIRHAAKLNTNNNQKCPVAPPSNRGAKSKRTPNNTLYHVHCLEAGNGHGNSLRVRVRDGHADLLETGLAGSSCSIATELNIVLVIDFSKDRFGINLLPRQGRPRRSSEFQSPSSAHPRLGWRRRAT
jgi:hypothetical protein